MPIYSIPALLPGTFYSRATPTDPPFKKAGEPVVQGDTIGLIEVMKSFFPVSSEVSGQLVQLLVEDGSTVEAGDLLAEVET